MDCRKSIFMKINIAIKYKIENKSIIETISVSYKTTKLSLRKMADELGYCLRRHRVI